MVQEVQTGVGITNETTLETIEAIGTSSFKIREGRQTTGHFTSGCNATGLVTRSSSGQTDSGKIKGTWNITDLWGKQEMIIKDGGIRVSSAGTYQLNLYWSGGGGTNYATIYIKTGNTTIYTKQFTTSNSESVTLYADLGKFDTIELWGEFYYYGGGSASLSLSAKLQIQQL